MSQVRGLFLIYGAGVVAVFGSWRCFTATRMQIYSNSGVAGVAVLSMVVALICSKVAPNLAGIAGYVYCAVGLVEWRIGACHRRMRVKLEAS